MGATRPSLADRIDKGQLRSAIGCQVFHQEHPLPLAHRAFNAGVAAITFRFLAHIGHRQRHTLGHKGGKGDARRLATGDVVKGLKASVAHDRDGQKIHQGRTDARIRDQLAAVDIGGRGQAGGQRKGRLGIEMHRLDFQERPGRQAGDFFGGRKGGRDHVGPRAGWRVFGANSKEGAVSWRNNRVRFRRANARGNRD